MAERTSWLKAQEASGSLGTVEHTRRTGTRREELITSQDELAKIWILRKLPHPMDELAAIEFLLDKMKGTKTNGDFCDAMKRG